jgi:hypothetical protein
MRAAEDKPRHWIVGACELEAVEPPHREVGALAGLERAEVVALQHLGAAARPKAKRFARSQRFRAAAAARHEQGLLDLQEEVAALV